MQVNIRPDLAEFINISAKADFDRQTLQIEGLEAFLRAQKGHLSRVYKKFSDKPTIDPKIILHQFYMKVQSYNYFLNQIKTEIFQYEVTHLTDIVLKTEEMINLVRSNPFIFIDVNNFTQTLLQKGSKNEQYLRLKQRKRSLTIRTNRTLTRRLKPDYSNMLRVEMLACARRYMPEIQYSPPSPFDDILIEFIMGSPIAEMVGATATIISEGSPASVMSTLSEFLLSVYKLLNITTENTRAIVYTSIVRFLFDQAYLISPELNKYQSENLLFMARCQSFTKQTVRELNLSESITKNFTPGLMMSSIFKSKQVDMLKQMELMTNPIDLMKHVHTILVALAQHFGSFLSFDDTLTLLLGLTSMNPPSNAVAIAKFVEKWNDVQLSTLVSVAKNYFIAAIGLLMKDELK